MKISTLDKPSDRFFVSLNIGATSELSKNSCYLLLEKYQGNEHNQLLTC